MDALKRFLIIHRRAMAAVFVGLAVLFTLGAIKPDEAGVQVVAARSDLSSGSVIVRSDVHTVRVPDDARPEHTWSDPDEVVGRRINAPMRAGEILTDYRLLSPGLLASFGKDMALATLRVADPTQLTALRVGDRVTIVRIDENPKSDAGDVTVIARSSPILALSKSDDRDAATVAVAVPKKVALKISTSNINARFSIFATS